jgi:predicted nucleic acid-binding protein
MSRTGAVGILIQAKVQGRIAELRGELDRLRTEGGFWIEDQLYRRAFQAVGEE